VTVGVARQGPLCVGDSTFSRTRLFPARAFERTSLGTPGLDATFYDLAPICGDGSHIGTRILQTRDTVRDPRLKRAVREVKKFGKRDRLLSKKAGRIEGAAAVPGSNTYKTRSHSLIDASWMKAR
jgi:hypothetical protein